MTDNRNSGGQDQVWKTKTNEREPVRTLSECRTPPGRSASFWRCAWLFSCSDTAAQTWPSRRVVRRTPLLHPHHNLQHQKLLKDIQTSLVDFRDLWNQELLPEHCCCCCEQKCVWRTRDSESVEKNICPAVNMGVILDTGGRCWPLVLQGPKGLLRALFLFCSLEKLKKKKKKADLVYWVLPWRGRWI